MPLAPSRLSFLNVVALSTSLIPKKARPSGWALVLFCSFTEAFHLAAMASLVPTINVIFFPESAHDYAEIFSVFDFDFDFRSFALYASSLLILFAYLLQVLKIYCLEKYGNRLHIMVYEEVLRSFFQAKFEWVRQKSSTEVSRILYSDIGTWSRDGVISLILLVSAIPVLMVTSVLIVFKVPTEGAVFMSSLIFLLYLFLRASRPLQERYADLKNKHNERYFGMLAESIRGWREIWFFDAGLRHLRSSRQECEKSLEANMWSRVFGSLPGIIVMPLGLISLLVIASLISSLSSNEAAAMEEISLALIILSRFIPLLTVVSSRVAQLINSKPWIENLYKLANQSTANESPQIRSAYSNVSFDNWISLDIEIRMQTNPLGETLFSDLKVKLKRGMVVGVFGESGRGKSTLLDIVSGLTTPTDGTVQLSFNSMEEVNVLNCSDFWRSEVAYVSQESIFFQGSVKENLLLNGVSDTEAESILKLVGLNARCGLGDQIDDRGYNLSGGQRKRLAIARALCSQKNILILDESTTAIDRDSELDLLGNLKQLIKPDKILIVVTHDKHLDLYCDSVIRL